MSESRDLSKVLAVVAEMNAKTVEAQARIGEMQADLAVTLKIVAQHHGWSPEALEWITEVGDEVRPGGPGGALRQRSRRVSVGEHLISAVVTYGMNVDDTWAWRAYLYAFPVVFCICHGDPRDDPRFQGAYSSAGGAEAAAITALRVVEHLGRLPHDRERLGEFLAVLLEGQE